MSRAIAAWVALACLAALGVAGCGGEKTDVTAGVDNLNERLSQQSIPAKLQCPDEVDGADGTEFDCTLEATEGDKKEKIKMEISKDGDDYVVDVKDQAGFERAVATVAAQQQPQQGAQGQGGGQQQPGQGGQQQPGQGGQQQPGQGQQTP
ncbi:MAG TPA: DUF4333 domain-containing protein [Thermoleophilaceae bacterium]